MGVLIVVASILGLLLLVMLAGELRSFFGKESGNLLLLLEFGLLIIAALVTHLWRGNKRTLGIGITCLALALTLGFLGWMVHPDQIYSRAIERVLDWEQGLDDYRSKLSKSTGNPDAALRLQRLTQELAARRSEYRAAEIRYTGEPEFFRSAFLSLSFWLLGVVLTALGILYFRQHINRQHLTSAGLSMAGRHDLSPQWVNMKLMLVVFFAILVTGGSIILWHTEWFQQRFFPGTHWRQRVNELQKQITAGEFMLSNMAIEVEKKHRTADLEVSQLTTSARQVGIDSESASRVAAEQVSQEIKGLTEGYQIVREMLEKNHNKLAEAEKQLARYVKPTGAGW